MSGTSSSLPAGVVARRDGWRFRWRSGRYARSVSLTRRQVLLGGGASAVVVAGALVGLVEVGVLPGKQRLLSAVGGCGPAGEIPTATPGPVATGSFRSAARGGLDTSWAVLYPPGADDHTALPVCVAMHGRGGSHTWVFEGVHLDRYLADGVTNHGVAPFVIASVDGGDATNWHRRASGEDPLKMVTDELLPILASRGLRVERVGLWGWSLGGFGALRLAALAGPSRVAAVVAASPALWRSFGETTDGVFDGPDDFAANDIFTLEHSLDSVPMRIDCGAGDPYSDAVTDLRAALHPTPDGGISPGCHESAYWTRVAPDELQFMGSHLATGS
jgi:dienelactone hydrolase